MAERIFEVEDIHCGGCEQGIRGGLEPAEGIEEVVPDQETNQVLVRFDESRVDEAAVTDLLAETGFSVRRVVEAGDERSDTAETPRDPASRGADERADSDRVAAYGLLVAAVAVAGLAGYVGYELYPRFDLPAAEGAGLLVLAAGAGIASFFAPCSFPLLVTLLSRPAGASKNREPAARPLVFGAALAAGAAAFLLLAGVVIAFGGRAFFETVTFTSTTGRTLRIVVGSLLIALGLVQTGVLASRSFHAVEGVTKNLNRSQARLRRKHPVAGYTAFGFFYLLAGFG
jgi:cytochrome c biogenesis protein CcdA/copper chaperone CopZ